MMTRITKRPPPLVLALAFAALVALSTAPSVADALSGLHRARAARDATVRRVQTPPVLPVPAERMIVAGTQARASDMLATRLRALAARGDMLVEAAAPVTGEGAARVRLRVSGSQDQVAGFADAVERDPQIMRFATWTLAGDGTAVRLSGEVVAPWR